MDVLKFIRNMIFPFKIPLIILTFSMKNLSYILVSVIVILNYNQLHNILHNMVSLNTQFLHLVVQRNLVTNIMRTFSFSRDKLIHSINTFWLQLLRLCYVHFADENPTSERRRITCIMWVAQLEIASQCPKSYFSAPYRALSPPILQL